MALRPKKRQKFRRTHLFFSRLTVSIKKEVSGQARRVGSELEDHFDELKSEIERRFGPRKNDGEVFRALPAPAGPHDAAWRRARRTPL